MNKNNYLFFTNKNLLLLFAPAISFFWSIYQAQFQYDWFHTAFVAFGSEAFLLNKTLFKDIFIPYGVLKTILHAYILKYFNHNIFLLIVFTSFCYSFGIYLISLIILNLIDYKNALFASVIIFLIHPVVQTPWHSYLLFFFLSLFIYLRVVCNNRYSIIIISFCIFISETFFLASFLILIFDLFYEKFFFKKKIININLIKTLFFYFLPIILFFSFIFYNSLWHYWVKNTQVASIAAESLFKKTIFQILLLRINEILIWPFTKFISAPQWFIFINIILINLYVLVSNIFKKKIINKDFLYIAFFSLVMMYTLMNSPNVFRYTTSSIIGIATYLFFLNKIDNFFIKKCSYVIIFLISLIGFDFNKSESNPYYVYDYQKKEYVNNNHFNYFASYKWPKETWFHLEFIDQKTLLFKSKCNIKYANNLVEDSFISLILQKNLKFDQIFFYNWIEDRHYFSKFTQHLFNHFNSDFNSKLNERINNKEVMIIARAENFPKVKINNEIIDFSKEMLFIKVPSHEFGNDRIIIYPKSCKI